MSTARAHRLTHALTQRAHHEAARSIERARPFRVTVTEIKDGGTDVAAAEMVDSNLELLDEDLTLGQAARRYGKRYGFQVGDELIVTPVRGADDDWIVTEVVSENDAPVTDPPAVGKPTGGGVTTAIDPEARASINALIDALVDQGVLHG